MEQSGAWILHWREDEYEIQNKFMQLTNGKNGCIHNKNPSLQARRDRKSGH